MTNLHRKPMISVLMSIYNEPERYIAESIGSLISQSYTDFECIIVLDKPDRKDVKPLIDSFHDKRLKLIKNEHNIGLALSMNKAAENAKADVFARMDADDISFSSRFEDEFNIIKEGRVDVVFTDYEFIDNDSNIVNRPHPFPDGIEGDVPAKIIAISPSIIHHPTVMMKKQIFDKVGGYRDFPCAQDTDLWMRMQEKGALFYLLKKPLLKYRVNPEGTTHKSFFKQQLTAHYIYKLSLERLKTGSDSFSKRNYELYMSNGGLNSVSKEKCFKAAMSFLQKAQESVFICKLFYRIFAFTISPSHRYFYIMKRKKMKLIDENISYNS